MIIKYFEYMTIYKGGYLEEQIGDTEYRATVSKDGFLTLRTKECEAALITTGANPPGWKLHISVDDENNNLIKAWDCIIDVFLKHKLSFVKIQKLENIKDNIDEPWDCGRQFTIYMQQNPEKTIEEWQALMNEITDIFVRENIRPGYLNPTTKRIEGSSYFSYKNDKNPKLEKQIKQYEVREESEDYSDTSNEEPTSPKLPSNSTSTTQVKKSVPTLNLQNVSTETKLKDTISCKEIYFSETSDIPEEFRYNPSRGVDIWASLVVNNPNQAPLREFGTVSTENKL